MHLQYSVEHITVDSSLLAQINNSGHVRYALELLEIDKKSSQVLGAALRRWQKELEAESALLESMEEKVNVRKDKVKAIEECVALRRKANTECKQLPARAQQENQSSFNRVHLGVVDSLRPGSMFGFDAVPVRRPAQALRGCRSLAGINDSPCLDHRSFGASSDAARLGIVSPGNNPGPAFDSPQCTLGRYQKVSPIGTPETPVAQRNLHKPEKDEPVPSRNSVTPDQGYKQGPCVGSIENDRTEEQTGAMNRERSSTPGLVSDALGMLGGGGGETSFGSGNKNEIKLIDGSRGPTSGRWDEHGGEGKDMVSEDLSSQSSATQNVIPPVDLSFG